MMFDQNRKTPMMALENPVPSFKAGTLANLRAHVQKTSAPLYWVGLALLLIALATLALTVIDARQLQGVSVWLKPFKFLLSTGVYLLTLALFMSWLPAQAQQSRTARYVVWAAVIAGLFEVTYITWQGSQGIASHFNTKTPFLATMYTLMGVGAVALASASLVLGVLIARTGTYSLPPYLKLAMVLGLVLTFVIGTGFGGYLSAQRTGHWVGGVLSDSGGLPIVKWSRSGGDLRVAHFFGIHAMHFIPAFALALGMARVPQTHSVRAVWIFAFSYSAFCVWTFVQARSGVPFLA
jgi:hypothetical protein